jgi:hypothetical protein
MGASSSRPTPMNYPGQRNQMQRNPNTNQQPNATASRVGNGNANANGTATSTISRPGAYGITRNTSSSNMQVYRVVVPPNVRPNQEFQVYGEFNFFSSIVAVITMSQKKTISQYSLSIISWFADCSSALSHWCKTRNISANNSS